MLFASDAAFWSVVVVFGLGVINIVFRLQHQQKDVVAVGISTIFAWVISFPFVWLVFYFGKPALVGPFHGMWFLFIPILITGICLVIGDAIASIDSEAAFGVSPIISVVLLVSIGIVAVYSSCGPRNGPEGLKLANTIEVTNEPADAYPDTDINHIIQVPEEVARFKASQIIAEQSIKLPNGSETNLATTYKPGKLELQSVQDHLYWIAPLDFPGRRGWNQVGQVSPGFIAVDAEDPNGEPQLKLGYKMKYLHSALMASQLHRRVYNMGYKDWIIDDLTLEVDDNWQPWFTATLNRPILRGTGAVPQRFIIVDPQKLDSKADIQELSLDEIPEWVDRVYSEDTVKRMVGWWGDFHDPNNPAKWTGYRPPTGRYKIGSKPVLVYTKGGHPDWQILLTSLNDDTAVTALMLFDARDNQARVYPILAGTPIEQQVEATFEGISLNARGDWEPKHLSVHKFYGHLAWVASYVLNRGDTSQGKGFQGLGIVLAERGRVEGANVVFGPNKEKALSLFRASLARVSSNEAPTENVQNKDITATIESISSQIENGETIYVMLLREAPGRIFKANRDRSVELPFTKAGDSVAIRYLDINNSPDIPYDISQFNNLSVPVVN